jgi:tetratricopeptide (TPR) repeat protein
LPDVRTFSRALKEKLKTADVRPFVYGGWDEEQELAEIRVGPATISLPDYEPDFVGRLEYLNQLSSMLLKEPGTCLLYGEPGTGKSILALKFAWLTQREFDAVVFQVCGLRELDEVSVELAEKLPINVKALPPSEQRQAAKKWLGERRSLLILDDVWDSDLKHLVPGPPVSVLCTSRMLSLPWVSPTNTSEVKGLSAEETKQLFRIFLGSDIVTRYSGDLLFFAERVGWLAIAVAVGADLLRRRCDPIDEAALALTLARLRNDVHDVPGLLEQAISALADSERRLIEAMASCVADGFWLSLAIDIAGLDIEQGRMSRDKLLNASLLRAIDRERQRFQLHPLVREQLRMSKGPSRLGVLQERHLRCLEELFETWEARWQSCRECLAEVAPALEFLRERPSDERPTLLDSWGFKAAFRTGEFDAGLRILDAGEKLWKSRNGRVAAEGLERDYSNRAGILFRWGRFDEAMYFIKKQEHICLDLNKKDGLVRALEHHGVILQAVGRSKEALPILQKAHALALEIGDNNLLCVSYSNLATTLKDLGRLQESMSVGQKLEALSNQLDDKHGLQASYLCQADILYLWRRREEAMALLKKQESLCMALGEKSWLQSSYFKQAVIHKDWYQFEDAITLLKMQEAICSETQSRQDLGYCYWQWADVSSLKGDWSNAKHKLNAALEIFSQLGLSQQQRLIRAQLKLGRLRRFVLRLQTRLSR